MLQLVPISRPDGPTPHLTWKEMGCRNGIPYPHELKYTIGITLALEFEEVRKRTSEYVGEDTPITIGSAYRPLEYNLSIGSKATSQHVLARALDMWTPGKIMLRNFHNIVVEVAKDRQIVRGVGLYPWGVHMDIRASYRLYHWTTGIRPAPEIIL